MTTLAAEAILSHLLDTIPGITYGSISGNYCTDNKPPRSTASSAAAKTSSPNSSCPQHTVHDLLHTTASRIAALNVRKNLIGTLLAGGIRTANTHYANMLLAFYLAPGQDAANIIEGSQGVTIAEDRDGDYFSCALPNLIIGTIGHGKHLDFANTNLTRLGCRTHRPPGDNARRLAVLFAATVLCGELSLLAAQPTPANSCAPTSTTNAPTPQKPRHRPCLATPPSAPREASEPMSATPHSAPPRAPSDPAPTPRTTTPPPEASQILDHARRVVDPALHAAVDRLPESMRTLASYHFGWQDEHGTPITTSAGKAIRPALVLLAAEAVGGTTTQALPAAVAVELVHNASLLHDDIIDRDRTRRHRPTTWAIFGIPAAILAGDALFFLATRTLNDAPAPLGTQGLTWLTDTVQQLIDGEYTDTLFEHRTDITLAQCQAMAHAKTSGLVACACALGALAGGATSTHTNHLREFGHHLGIAFQLIDDLLGIWGDPTHTGKPHQSDLRAHKQSLPVVAALTSDTTAGRELADLYTHTTMLTEQQLHHAATLIDTAGGRAWATQQAHHHLTTALHHLHITHLAPHPTAHLTTLAHFITHRNH